MLSQHYRVRVICGALGWARSSYYYQSIETEEDELRGAGGVSHIWGYGRWAVNHKRVVRLMRQIGLLQRVRGRKCKTTDSKHDYPRYPNLVEALEVVCPNQVWVCDITYVRLHQEFIYLAAIMDVFSRAIRGWELSRSLDQSLTLMALKRALFEVSVASNPSFRPGRSICRNRLHRFA